MAPRMKVEVDASTSSGAGQNTTKPKTAAPKPTVDTPAASVSEPKSAAAPTPAAAPKPRVEPQPAASNRTSVSSAAQPAVQQAAAPKPNVSVAPPASSEQVDASEANAGARQQPADSGQFVAQDPNPMQEPRPTQPAVEPQRQRRTFGETCRVASGWVHTTFPGHEHAFYGGLIALLTALLIFIIGPLHVLILYVLVIVGIAIGQFFDGDPKIIRMVGDLFNGNREQR